MAGDTPLIFVHQPNRRLTTTYGLVIYVDGEKFKLTLYFWVEGAIKYIKRTDWLFVFFSRDSWQEKTLGGHSFSLKTKSNSFATILFFLLFQWTISFQWPLFTIIRDSTIFLYFIPFLNSSSFQNLASHHAPCRRVSGQFNKIKRKFTGSDLIWFQVWLYYSPSFSCYIHRLLLFENYDCCGWWVPSSRSRSVASQSSSRRPKKGKRNQISFRLSIGLITIMKVDQVCLDGTH